MALSPDEIAGLARDAGVTDQHAVAVAVAIALAESGGVPLATHRNTDAHRTIDYGLWQINGYWHRDKYKPAELLTATGNARAMADISKNGSDWSAWTTFSSGRYRKYMDQGLRASLVLKPALISPGEVASGVAKAATSIPEALGSIADAGGTIIAAVTDVGFWKRVALGLAGAAAIYAGATLVAKDSLLPAVSGELLDSLPLDKIGKALNQ